MALACGYRYAETISDLDKLEATLERHIHTDGPTLLRVVIKTGSRTDLGRPDLSPRDGYLRFSAFLTGRHWAGPITKAGA
jgi:phosphonopyruvate decarboxylase